jgi:hypothetical protein
LIINVDLCFSAGPWLEQKIPQGFLFYYNTTTQQSSWAKPADFTNNSGLLTKEEIQVCCETPFPSTPKQLTMFVSFLSCATEK